MLRLSKNRMGHGLVIYSLLLRKHFKSIMPVDMTQTSHINMTKIEDLIKIKLAIRAGALNLSCVRLNTLSTSYAYTTDTGLAPERTVDDKHPQCRGGAYSYTNATTLGTFSLSTHTSDLQSMDEDAKDERYLM